MTLQVIKYLELEQVCNSKNPKAEFNFYS